MSNLLGIYIIETTFLSLHLWLLSMSMSSAFSVSSCFVHRTRVMCVEQVYLHWSILLEYGVHASTVTWLEEEIISHILSQWFKQESSTRTSTLSSYKVAIQLVYRQSTEYLASYGHLYGYFGTSYSRVLQLLQLSLSLILRGAGRLRRPTRTPQCQG